MKQENIPMDAQGLTFTSQDFSKRSFADYSFSNCVFENCDFTDGSFERASLWECTFKHCNLSLVSLIDCRMKDVLLEESKLAGVDFSRCDASLLFSINAYKSFLRLRLAA